jgi:hypothetical protein
MGFFETGGSPGTPESSPKKRGRTTAFSWLDIRRIICFFEHFQQTINTSACHDSVAGVNKMHAILGRDRP